MRIFLTSDHHFFHANIIKYCNRPFQNVEEMNETMIERWNNVVGKEDLVLHLGDLLFGNRKKLIDLRQKLNGAIILIKGNHDYKIPKTLDIIVVDGPVRMMDYILTHQPLPKKEIPKGIINVHGHIHEKDSLHGINVSVEKTNYEPIELPNLKAYYSLSR